MPPVVHAEHAQEQGDHRLILLVRPAAAPKPRRIHPIWSSRPRGRRLVAQAGGGLALAEGSDHRVGLLDG
jgi:hypothetical protein